MKSYHTSPKTATLKITPFPTPPALRCPLCKHFACKNAAHDALVANAEAFEQFKRDEAARMARTGRRAA